MGNSLLSPIPYLLYHFRDDSLSNHPLVFRNPVEIIAAYRLEEVQPALNRVNHKVQEGYWAAGFVTFEAAKAFNPALTTHPPKSDLPLAWFGVFKSAETLDFDDEAGILESSIQEPQRPMEWIPSIPETTYAEHIDEILRRIAAGETYQVNYTFRLKSPFTGESLDHYRRIQAATRTPYSAFMDIGSHQLLSFSPELFYQTIDRSITVRPMKGTIRRGRWPAEDTLYESQLAASEKDRAENLMIVDLLRSDVGQIAQTGTVKVNDLFTVERYPTVFQMTSSISATLRNDVGLWETFQALFPSGSITGAPKVSTMSIIRELEQEPRGIYCGAIGYVKPGGDALFNVAIRTLSVEASRGLACYGIGGGITWDSAARSEYDEALSKAEWILNPERAVSLLETMLFDQGAYYLLDEHLARLESSAHYYNIPVNRRKVMETLAAHAKTLSTTQQFRVRMILSENGKISVQSTPIPPLQPDFYPVVSVADWPVSKWNPQLYHKVANRKLYDTFRHHHPEYFDVLLWNEDGHLTEFTIGNLVVELDGKRITPPLSCGLLPGTMRAYLLATGVIEEQCITRKDLRNASQVWLINSVRRWVKVCVVDSES